MQITVSQEQGRVPVTVLQLEGNVDSSTAQQFERKAKEAISNGSRHMLLDLSDMPYMSSAGLRTVNAIFIQLRNLSPEVSDEEMHRGIRAGTYRSPHLKLLGPNDNVRNAIRMAGFDMYLEIFDDLKTAIASF